MTGSRHIAIVGAGSVGTAIAFACLVRGVAPRLTLYDIDDSRARAEILDLNHGIEFVPQATVDGGGDIGSCKAADIIVVTAGAKQKPGQSRLDLASTNAAMCRDLLPKLLDSAPNAVVLMVTNPVDVITQVASHVIGGEPGRVFGTGTVLDSSRLRFLVAQHCAVAVQNVHAYVVGEHGDSEIALWSSARIAGISLLDWRVPGRDRLDEPRRAEIMDRVKRAAYEIIAGKGATNWAIGLATARILEAVLDDQRRVLPVTAPVRGEFGLHDVCLSLPRVVHRGGVGEVLPTPLSPAEERGLADSADAIRKTIRSIGF
jgi:L-lactate dehydrogenase